MPAQKRFFKFLFLILGFIFGVALSMTVCAATMSLTFSNSPASVEEEESFEIDVSLVNAPTERTYYFRAAFYEEGKTQYLGYTFNHEGNWHNAPSDHTKFLKITTSQEGSWSGRLKAKTDLNASAFKGPGSYQFKIGRYTEGGSLSWSDNNATIVINVQPTPIPTSTPEPTPTNTSMPTNTPTPKLTPTPKPASTPTPTPTTRSISTSTPPPTKTLTTTPTPTPSGEILGATETGSKEPEEGSEEKSETSPYLWPRVLIGLGAALIIGATYPFWLPKVKMLYNSFNEKG